MTGRTAAFAAISAATLIGTCGIFALATAATAQTGVPLPAPRPSQQQAPAAKPQPPMPLNPGAQQKQQPQQQQAAPAERSATPSIFPKPPNIFGKPGETTAFDARQRQLADRVSTYLSNIRTLQGDFVQVGPDGGKSEGEFFIQKPGKVRFDYNPPSPVELIADGSSVVVRDRKLATQDLYPLSQTPLRFLLSDQLDLMRDTNVVGVYADDVFVTVVIEERQIIAGTHRLMMMFGAKDMQLKQWTVTDPQGYDTTIAVYNLDTTKRPDPNLFRIDYTRDIK